MNIFFLDRDVVLAARYHHDSHCVKMILETAQLLSTAHRVIDADCKDNDELYKATHINHPSAIWVRRTDSNYLWTYNLFVELLKEYTYRYGKHHKCEKLIERLKNIPKNIQRGAFSEPPACVVEDCKIDGDTVQSYKNYYNNHKQFTKGMRENKYTRREKPNWLCWK